MTQLVNLCRSLEKLDTNALLSKVQAVQDTLKQLAGAKDKVASFTGKVKDVITAIGDFFDRQALPAGGFLHTKARAVHQHRPLRFMLFLLFCLPLFPALFACLFALCFPFLPVARLLLLRTCVGFCTRLKHGFVPFRKIFAEHRRIPHQELILDQPIAASDFFNRFLWQWF